MCIQHTVLGFEPSTFRFQVSSPDHYTRAPAQKLFWTQFNLSESPSCDGFIKMLRFVAAPKTCQSCIFLSGQVTLFI